MSHDGKYAHLITVCSPEIRGTAVCNFEAECETCKFALQYEINDRLKLIGDSLGAYVDASQKQIDTLSESLQKYGVPICLCSVYVEGFVPLEIVSCPRNGCAKEISENGICNCHVFKKVGTPLFFSELLKRTEETTENMKRAP
jgi:ferredoxin-thioredoxin reductase catalytic subunit